MEFMTGERETQVSTLREIFEEQPLGKEVTVEGAVHSIRDMGRIVFVTVRTRDGLLQTVFEKEEHPEFSGLKEAMCLRVQGRLRQEARAPRGLEIALEGLEILSAPAAPLPLPIDKWKLNTSLEARLNQRALALRHPRERAIFRIQEGIVRAFRDFLWEQGFTEVHTPKVGARSAEGGANLFRLSYFHKPAVLQQSPQLYKQMLVGVFDRVFETGPVFRAEKHNTKRHLNEYTSLDFEMGYIRSFRDVMEMETGFLRHMMEFLAQEYYQELKLLGVELPSVEQIPAVPFRQAKELVAKKYGRAVRSPQDLEPEEEQLIGEYFKEEYGSDFVFVTHYPSGKRPFYAMEDPEDPTVTLSFDLLFRGLEVTTGGQRIHEYGKLIEKMEARGMTEEGLEEYLDAFRYGMPPHGGLGIGLERMTMQLLGEENIREASLFPRDLSRLKP